MKVIGLTGSCMDCPKRHYYSAGRHECSAAREMIPTDTIERRSVPGWCPLPDYPAAEMNRLVEEVAGLRRALELQSAMKAPAE